MNTNITMSDTPFKERYQNHKTSFRHISHLTVSDLSKYYWKLVDNGTVPTIKFSIAKRVKRNTFINNCNLCLSENAFTIRNLDDVNMLKKVSIYIKVYLFRVDKFTKIQCIYIYIYIYI